MYSVHVHVLYTCVWQCTRTCISMVLSYACVWVFFLQEFVSSDPVPTAPPPHYHQGVGLAPPTQSMQWSVWSVWSGHPTPPGHPPSSSSSPLSHSDPMAASTLDTLQLHQVLYMMRLVLAETCPVHWVTV